jgi:demethoxyubiquinone hydroxylase (CLK1/Coq7/Cat5 family)
LGAPDRGAVRGVVGIHRRSTELANKPGGLFRSTGFQEIQTIDDEEQERAVNQDQLHDLLYQAFETELGGVQIYETALRCVRNDDLREEWEKYHKQTAHHVEIAEGLLHAFDLDPAVDSPGRRVVRHIGTSLVTAMEMALEEGSEKDAQLVAAECVTLAETKDHLNWELIGEAAGQVKGAKAKELRSALAEVEEQEDEHLYHTTGWTRELWIDALGMPSVLPPPEEKKDVKTAIGAARAKQVRSEMT